MPAWIVLIFHDSSQYYRKRGSASYIVCEVHSVRERERERERDTERERERERERGKDGSDVTIVALNLAMSFALLLAKNVHLSIGDEFCAFPCQKICTSVSPLLNGAEFTLSVVKNVALFETVRILRTVKWRDWHSSKANDRISGCTVFGTRRRMPGGECGLKYFKTSKWSRFQVNF